MKDYESKQRKYVMDLSIFLSKLLGIYYLIFGLSWLIRRKQVEAAVKEVMNSVGMLAVSGAFMTLFGLAMVLNHSMWETSWRGLVTLIAYIILVKGALRFGFPKESKKILNFALQNKSFMIPIVLIIGIYLTYMGFMS